MGAFGEAMWEFAQPLIDATDGSAEQVSKAMTIAMVVWNLSLLDEEGRAETFTAMQREFGMNDKKFAKFRADVIEPMIDRHEWMFPKMHKRAAISNQEQADETAAPLRVSTFPRREAYPGTGRNAPCPCGSGKKYKRCCGQ